MKRIAIAVLVAALGNWAVLTPAAHADSRQQPVESPADLGTCVTSSHVAIEPGLTMNPAPFIFEEEGTGTCQTSSGPLTATYSVVHGQGEGSCATAHFASVPIMISWSDGMVTKGMATGTTYGALVVAAAKLVEGRFAGGSYRFFAVATTTDPTLCGSTGLRQADVHGKMDFSVAPA